MVTENILKRIATYLPADVKSWGKKLYYRDRHWANSSLKNFGTVQDLYYWVSDGNLDTLLLLQNYFSVLYPLLRTDTKGIISLYDSSGEFLAGKPFSIAQFGSAKFRVSRLLKELLVMSEAAYGTLEVKIEIPDDVLNYIQEQKSVYFWDRFYLGYTNASGQTCFVHGVDKTHIYHEGKPDPVYWYKPRKGREWAPEIPVDIDDYEKFDVIMLNRTEKKSNVTLVLSDIHDKSLSWAAEIPSKGVHRFELTKENTSDLAPTELRMRVKGMPTQFGRPIIFKEFSNNAISAMHC